MKELDAAIDTAVSEDQPAVVADLRLVVVQLNDQGGFQVHPQGVSDLETPTLLRLAAKAVEDRLGI